MIYVMVLIWYCSKFKLGIGDLQSGAARALLQACWGDRERPRHDRDSPCWMDIFSLGHVNLIPGLLSLEQTGFWRPGSVFW